MTPSSTTQNTVTEEPAITTDSSQAVPQICIVHDNGISVKAEGFRDAMGEYHPPPGGKQLTSLCADTPAPNKYTLPNMNLTLHAAPSYFLSSRPKDTLEKVDGASPASYKPRYPPKCKHELLTTLKPRIEPPKYESSPGPHKYYVKNNDVAQKPPKTTIKSRPPPTASFGPHNPLDHTSFTKTPGPKYDPITAHLHTAPKFCFNSRNIPTEYTTGPGSGALNIRRGAGGPRYSMCPLPTLLTPMMNNPGPETYDPVPVDPDPHTPTIAVRIPDPTPDQKPGPETYTPPQSKKHAPTLTFRPFEPEEFHTPAPNSYFAEKLPEKRAPAFSMGRRLRARSHCYSNSGPAASNLQQQKAQTPAFTLAGRPKSKLSQTPAPNAYSPRRPVTTNNGFSMVGLQPKEKLAITPGPSTYQPKAVLPRAPTLPLGIKHRDMGDREAAMVPSPAHYALGDGCGCSAFHRTKKGASFKSRASKYMFSGFDANRNMTRLPAKVENTRTPII